MSDWTAGYVADIGYTYGYYTELNPLRVKLPFLSAGIAFPEISTACELGFGQGMSTNIHAVASTVQWWGTDFNPAQAGFAQNWLRLPGLAHGCSIRLLPSFATALTSPISITSVCTASGAGSPTRTGP